MDDAEFHLGYAARVASPEYEGRRDAYLLQRNAELNRIARLDASYREFLNRKPDPDQYQSKLSVEEDRLRNAEAFGLGIVRRQLVHAAEGFLLTCMEVSSVTGEDLVGRATSTEDLVVRLRFEEEDMTATFKPPWDKNEKRNYA
jgi:hypothetical protein